MRQKNGRMLRNPGIFTSSGLYIAGSDCVILTVSTVTRQRSPDKDNRPSSTSNICKKLTSRNATSTAYHDSTGLVILNVLRNFTEHLLRTATEISAVFDFVKCCILLCLFHTLLCIHTQNFSNNLQSTATSSI